MMDISANNPRAVDISTDDLIKIGQDTFEQEAAELNKIAKCLDSQFAEAARHLLNSAGTVLVTGLGKSGIIARKLAATFTSTGTPSQFIHPVEAAHGDLGVVRGSGVLISISNSGKNQEVVALVKSCRHFGMTTIAITGKNDSLIAQFSDLVLHVPIEREACPLNLTPTTSTTAAMAMGDALAVALIKLRGFRKEDFAIFHPSGVLGRSLLMRVSELMHSGDELPVVSHKLSLRESLPEIVGKRLGGTCVVADDGTLAGLCVDGDVKRIILESEDALDLPITQAMNANPTTISPELLAIDALRLMEQRKEGPITLLLVVDDKQHPVGLLHIHDILRAGIL